MKVIFYTFPNARREQAVLTTKIREGSEEDNSSSLPNARREQTSLSPKSKDDKTPSLR